MGNEYDIITAKHYNAYRPPLHDLILENCIGKYKQFNSGLDIGCGTGKSTIALSKYCSNVIGVDPSPDMIKMTSKHNNIEYLIFDGKNLDFADRLFDIITFAGSLFYAKSQEILDEVLRVSVNNALILLYDFEILLNNFYPKLSITIPPEEIIYNHAIDFSGLESSGLEKIDKCKEEIEFKISPANLAHILLSLKTVYNTKVRKFNEDDPFSTLEDLLAKISNNSEIILFANIYYTKYKYKTPII